MQETAETLAIRAIETLAIRAMLGMIALQRSRNHMPAKGFLGEVREAVRHFYAVDMRHEVSDANIRGYLRAASQIEDVWQQVDERIATALTQGASPWDAYGRMRYALAFIRAARAHQIFVRELLAADAAFDPATVGYLPPVTYDQCN